METRKIQKVGYSTLMVSLPNDWVKKSGLRQGDIVTCIPQGDGSIKITPTKLTEFDKENRESIVNVDLCDDDKILERVIVGNYMLGQDTITINSSKKISSTHLSEIRNATLRLMGMGIIEENPEKIVLQCSIDPSKFSLDTLLKRMFSVVSTMHKEVVSEALVSFNLEAANEVINREQELDMLYWLIVRLITSAQQEASIAEKVGVQKPLHLLDYRIASKYLETIGDYLEDIAKEIIVASKYTEQVRKQTIYALAHISSMTIETCGKALECLFTGEMKKANHVLKIKENVHLEEEKLVNKLSKEYKNMAVAYNLRSIAWSLRRIAEYGESLAHIAINRYLEDSTKLCQHSF